jgi:hypothetical protein
MLSLNALDNRFDPAASGGAFGAFFYGFYSWFR